MSASADYAASADSADHPQTPVPVQSPSVAIQEQAQEAVVKRSSAMRHTLSILQLFGARRYRGKELDASEERLREKRRCSWTISSGKPDPRK